MLRRPHLDLPRQRRRKSTHPSSVTVHLHISSMAFAKFAIDEPRYFQPAKTLQPTLWGKTATIRYTCTQITTDALLSICVLVFEPLLFGWPSTVRVGKLPQSTQRSTRQLHPHRWTNTPQVQSRPGSTRCRPTRLRRFFCNFPWFSLIRRIADFAAQHVGCNTRVQYPESLC